MSAQQNRNNALESYVTVAERIGAFYQAYPSGRITTHIVEHDAESGFILFRAEVFRDSDDAQPSATGHAFEMRGDSYVNRTSYIENAETSAVGRALALLGFEVKRGIASREEMQKATRKSQPVATDTARAERTRPEPKTAPAPQNGEEKAADALSPAATERGPDLDALILQVAGELGYDSAKVRKWVNNKFEVTGGLGSLTDPDKQEVLKLFREQFARAQDRVTQG
jgi:hypothetical protein